MSNLGAALPEGDQTKGYPFIERILRRQASELTLELGCGRPLYVDVSPGRYFGLDVTRADYRADQPRGVDVVASARFLPFQDKTFGLIFEVAALYLFPGPVLCLKEAHRCLAPGGRFISFNYTRRTLEGLIEPYYADDVPHHSIWTGRQLVRWLKAVGFQQVRWFVPPWGRGLRTKLLTYPASLASPVYRYFHDSVPGWWVIEGVK